MEKRPRKIGELALPDYVTARAEQTLRLLDIDSKEKLLSLDMTRSKIKGCGIKTIDVIKRFQG